MKVLFDHQIFSLQRYGGVSKYFFELLKNIPPDQWETTVYFSNNEYIRDKSLIKHRRFIPDKTIKGYGRLSNELNKLYAIYKIKKNDFDIYHQTHYQTFSFPYLEKKKLITTFHDMNFTRFNHPELSIQKKSVQRANKIIAISQNTKNELVEMWKIPEEKIQVIYHGVQNAYNKNLIGTRIIKDPYLLYVGLRSGYKNFENFLSAFCIIKDKMPELKLVCTGLAFTTEEFKLLNTKKVVKSVIRFGASEIAMANLYSNAEMFVYPSLYEGFGMPILEAMSYSCPTIISNTSCFPEIAGEDAFYFDPYSVESMADEMLKLLTNDALRKSKLQSASILCKKFTWEKCADEHLKVYNSMI